RMHKDVSSSLKHLSLSTSSTTPPSTSRSLTASKEKASSKPAVADSWEDEASDPEDNDDNDTTPPTSPATRITSTDYPSAPPPTPSSPTAHSYSRPSRLPSTNLADAFDGPSHRTVAAPRPQPPRSASSSSGTAKRPETSTSVASRLIAAGLGVRALKRSEDERAYEKSVREQELKRKERAREDERRRVEEAERAKSAVWED
ncbi:hypothetical protein LTR16_006766, partial [Cryomyces antarcticus]